MCNIPAQLNSDKLFFDQTPPTLNTENFEALPFGPFFKNRTPLSRGGWGLWLPLVIYDYMASLQLYCLFLWMGFNCLKITEPL